MICWQGKVRPLLGVCKLMKAVSGPVILSKKENVGHQRRERCFEGQVVKALLETRRHEIQEIFLSIKFWTFSEVHKNVQVLKVKALALFIIIKRSYLKFLLLNKTKIQYVIFYLKQFLTSDKILCDWESNLWPSTLGATELPRDWRYFWLSSIAGGPRFCSRLRLD